MSLNQSDIEAFIKAANDREQKTTLFFGIVKAVQDATITVETRSGDLIYAISYVYANVGDQVACLSRGTSIVAFAAKDAEALKSSISETVDSVSFQYLQTSSSSETPQGNWSDTAPEWQDGKYMWQRSKTVKSDGSISYGDPVCLSGSTGATGAKGEKGADGRGISVVSSVYQLSDSGTEQPSGEWSDEPLAQTDALPYLWVRNLVIYTDGTSDSFYSVSAKGDKGSQGDQGIQGIKGADGSSSYLHIAYATSEDGRSGFSTYDSTGKTYIGQYVDENPLDSEEYTKYSWSLIKGDKGDKGDTGDTGNGIRDITQYYLATASGSDVTISTKGWTTAIQTITAAKKYLWNFEKVTYTDGTESTSTPVIIGVYGDTGAKGDKGDKGATGADGATGNGIASIAEHYQVSSSSSTTPTTWQSTVPTMTATNKYLWNYETVTYTDGTTSDTSKRVIGAYGDTGAKGATGETGKGIKSTAITYQVGSSGTSAPTGTWVATVQATSAGQYLWTRTVTTYTDNSIVTSYSVAAHGATGAAGKNGTDGTSVTIKSQAVTYASSTSGTDTPTSWQTSIPVVAAGSYLWTRTIVTYSDGTSTTGYSVARQGSDGKDGSNGADGKDGTAIFATCSTASGTSAKVATIVSGTLASLTEGATVTVSFASGNTASAPTLKVGSTAAKPIMCNGTNAAYWEAGNVMFTYDGTYWQVCSAAIYGKTATVGNPTENRVYIDQDSVSIINGEDSETYVATCDITCYWKVTKTKEAPTFSESEEGWTTGELRQDASGYHTNRYLWYCKDYETYTSGVQYFGDIRELFPDTEPSNCYPVGGWSNYSTLGEDGLPNDMPVSKWGYSGTGIYKGDTVKTPHFWFGIAFDAVDEYGSDAVIPLGTSPEYTASTVVTNKTTLSTFAPGAITLGEATGKNVYIDNDSVDIRNGSTVTSTFTANSARVGSEDGGNVLIGTNSVSIREGTRALSTFKSFSGGFTNINSVDRLLISAGRNNSNEGVSAPKSVYFSFPPDEATGDESDIGCGLLVSDGGYGVAAGKGFLYAPVTQVFGEYLRNLLGQEVINANQSNGNFSFGYGNYAAGTGQANYYGNKVNISSKSGVSIGGNTTISGSLSVSGRFVKVVSASSSEFSVAATSTETATVSLAGGSGWYLVGITRISTGNSNVSIAGWNVDTYSGTATCKVWARNQTSSARKCTVSIEATFIHAGS